MTGTFIHPFAISRMPPMPEVNTDDARGQPDHHPVGERRHLLVRERHLLGVEALDVDRVQQRRTRG